MRLGGASSGGETPLAMGTGNDYAELSELGPSRWSSSSRGGLVGNSSGVGGVSYPPPSAIYQPSSTASTSRIRSNSFEAEDVIGPYGSARVANSTSSLRGRTGLYYSPPGTSYTIVERERDRPFSPPYYYNTAGSAPTKGSSLPSRASYLEPSSLSASGGVTNSARHTANINVGSNGKKRPISPEQILRMFNTTTSSQSVPTNYHSSNGTARDRGRRSPASSPPSTTHQVRKVHSKTSSTIILFFSFSSYIIVIEAFLRQFIHLS